MVDKLTMLFNQYLTVQPLFLDRKALQSNYIPNELLHREAQIEQLGKMVAPALRNNKPSNVFVYGKTGTGKTHTVQHVAERLIERNKNKSDVHYLYLNCKLKKIADTEYRLIAQIIRELGHDVPATGLPTQEIYKIFYTLLDDKSGIFLFVLDEIDQLVKKIGDEVLYNLTRMNSDLKNTQIAIIGISNDLVFTSGLDPRVTSSLCEEKVLFPPYNALQIQDILRQRAQQAFRENTLAPGVIEKCSAYAAKEHGDARRALELLRIAGELAEREGKSKVTLQDIDAAEEKIEKDIVIESVLTQTKQFQATLLSIFKLTLQQKKALYTGEIYIVYQSLCAKLGLRPLTQRRISDILAELDMLGIINAKVISKGRYGRTKAIELTLPAQIVNHLMPLLTRELGDSL